MTPTHPRNSRIRFFSTSILLLLGAIVCHSICISVAHAQDNREYVEAGVYSMLRDHIERDLVEKAMDVEVVDYTVVRQVAESALNEHWNVISGDMVRIFGSDNRISDALEAREFLRQKIGGISEPFVRRGTDEAQIRADVNLYLLRVLGEARDFSITEPDFTNPYSFYQALMGLSWTHPDSGSATPLFAAAVYFRTRVADYRNGDFRRTSDVEGMPEEFFADILVDAQFLTSDGLAVPQLTGDSSSDGEENLIGNDEEIRSFLVRSVRSSKLSMAVFLGSPPVFADRGVVGPFLRFDISTQENSPDVFRRGIIGVRLEHRGVPQLYGANVEVGLTSNRTAGALTNGNIFGRDRIVLNFQMPLRSPRGKSGMFIEFRGEWPVREKDNLRSAPPIYQFRLGATFDPVRILSPIFGFLN